MAIFDFVKQLAQELELTPESRGRRRYSSSQHYFFDEKISDIWTAGTGSLRLNKNFGGPYFIAYKLQDGDKSCLFIKRSNLPDGLDGLRTSLMIQRIDARIFEIPLNGKMPDLSDPLCLPMNNKPHSQWPSFESTFFIN